MLERLTRFCYRRRWFVLVAWAVFALGLVSVAGMLKPDFSSEYTLGDSDSQRAYDVLAEHFSDQAGGTGEIVFRAEDGLRQPEIRRQVEATVAQVREADPVVLDVTSPYAQAAAIPISTDGTTAVATIQFSTPRTEVPDRVRDEIIDIAAEANGPGRQVELSGTMFAPVPSTGLSETVGFVAAALILLVSFGALLMVGLPLLTALVGLFSTMGAVMLAAKLMDVPDFTMSVAVMMVIGVGVDYSLFIASRYLAGLRSGLSPEAATVSAVDTAGRAVVFAATTVVISLGGMLFMGVAFVNGLAVGTALGVALTLLVAITLLPALFGLLGRRVLTWRIAWRSGRSVASTRSGGDVWGRWSEWATRRALPLAIVVPTTLLVMVLPVFSMSLGSSDAGNASSDETTRRAFDLKTVAYGAGSTAPLQVVVDLRDADMSVARRVAEAVVQTPGVDQVSPPQPSADRQAALISVLPTTDAQDGRTVDLIETLREQTLPRAVASSPARAHVGGVTATFQDLADQFSSRLPLFLAAVLGLSLLLLIAVFRSLLLPLQAVAMTLLSLAAAYGVLVMVFEWGWGSGLLGTARTGPVESYMPMTLMALLFGLSMDYQVFLLSRIKEALLRVDEPRLALRDGMRASGRVVVAAALIMAAVFASFTLSPDRVMKQFGLGLSAGILIEAIVVLTVTPALVTLFGRRAWVLPRRLRWIPELHVEGASDSRARSTSDPERPALTPRA